jgi:protein-disulfide isomerase
MRLILDFAASVAVIAASVSVVGFVVVKWSPHADQLESARIPADPAVPAAPQPLTGATVIGNPAARVAMIQYSDFACPFCGAFALETWPEIKRQYIESGKLLSAFRYLPQRERPSAAAAARGAYCADQQQQFLQMHDLLFQHRGDATERTNHELASQLRLNMHQFDDCLLQGAEAHVQQDIRSAVALGINGTPTFLIGRVAGNVVTVSHIISGAQTFELFRRTFDELLDGAVPHRQ